MTSPDFHLTKILSDTKLEKFEIKFNDNKKMKLKMIECINKFDQRCVAIQKIIEKLDYVNVMYKFDEESGKSPMKSARKKANKNDLINNLEKAGKFILRELGTIWVLRENIAKKESLILENLEKLLIYKKHNLKKNEGIYFE